MSRLRLSALGVIAVLAASAGYAVAQLPALSDDPLPAASCPEAASAFKDAGLSFDTFSPDCPSSDEVAEAISEYRGALQAKQEALDYAATHEPAPSIAIADCPYLAQRLQPVNEQLENAGEGRLKTINDWGTCPSNAEADELSKELESTLPEIVAGPSELAHGGE